MRERHITPRGESRRSACLLALTLAATAGLSPSRGAAQPGAAPGAFHLGLPMLDLDASADGFAEAGPAPVDAETVATLEHRRATALRQMRIFWGLTAMATVAVTLHPVVSCTTDDDFYYPCSNTAGLAAFNSLFLTASLSSAIVTTLQERRLRADGVGLPEETARDRRRRWGRWIGLTLLGLSVFGGNVAALFLSYYST